VNPNGSITHEIAQPSQDDPDGYAKIHTNIRNMAVIDLEPLGELSKAVHNQKEPLSFVELFVGRRRAAIDLSNRSITIPS